MCMCNLNIMNHTHVYKLCVHHVNIEMRIAVI